MEREYAPVTRPGSLAGYGRVSEAPSPPERVGTLGPLAAEVQRSAAIGDLAWKVACLASELEGALLGPRAEPGLTRAESPPRPEPMGFARAIADNHDRTLSALEVVHDALNRIQAAL